MAACPDPLATQLPELCHSVTPEVRAAVHAGLRHALGEFFLKHLGNAELTPPAAAPR